MHKLVDCIGVRIDVEAPVKDQQRLSTKSDEEYDENNKNEEQQISESQEDDESGGEETQTRRVKTTINIKSFLQNYSKESSYKLDNW